MFEFKRKIVFEQVRCNCVRVRHKILVGAVFEFEIKCCSKLAEERTVCSSSTLECVRRVVRVCNKITFVFEKSYCNNS